MKFKELLKVNDSNAYLNIVSEKEHWLYEGGGAKLFLLQVIYLKERLS